MSRSISTFRSAAFRINLSLRPTHRFASTLNAAEISRITEKEKEITGDPNPVAGGPTAQAQRHAGRVIDSEVVRDITAGEKQITQGERVRGGPTSAAQSMAAQTQTQKGVNQNETQSTGNPTGTLDSATISRITAAEKEITGADGPVRGGPTAKAQKYANQTIGKENLSEITKGEKKITGREGPVAGGPTAVAQGETS